MAGRQWGDDDDDDYLPPRQESAVDSKGVKSIVEYRFEDGQKIKRTTKVKVFSQQTRVHKACLERLKWNKFGLAGQVDDNSNYTILSLEEVKLETPQESRDADDKPNSMEDSLKEAMERMRRKHAMRTAGLLESNDAVPPAEDESGGAKVGQWALIMEACKKKFDP